MSEENKDLPLITPMVIQPILESLKDWLRRYRHRFTRNTHVGNERGGCPTCGTDAIFKEVIDFDAMCEEMDAFGEELRRARSSGD